MDNFIKDIVTYTKTGNSNILLTNYSSEIVNTLSFNTAIIDVLSWLKLGYKREQWMKDKKYMKHKPLKINMDHTWCEILKELVENDDRFSNYFTINDTAFDFKETISEEIRLESRKTAFNLYNPQMRK
ncbi:hypothetical protein [Bacillus sp. UNC437CL72CviS29]|uniref:hypothetical protein n=1 Tax=Bacillus sp. UNC437CL72CviS29 TaxID=1340430 RepID=UPI00047E7662|nr:hypothetical protein [Bacillus sp. UNC437CL72CviS29]